jgi:hypothetical protein
MGGLLAAEAATDPSNLPDEATGKPHRIVGIVAFDTPYLGMHPHVIISGIASLLPKDSKEEEKLEKEMNAHPDITVVPGQVTDDWEQLRRRTGECVDRVSAKSVNAIVHYFVHFSIYQPFPLDILEQILGLLPVSLFSPRRHPPPKAPGHSDCHHLYLTVSSTMLPKSQTALLCTG